MSALEGAMQPKPKHNREARTRGEMELEVLGVLAQASGPDPTKGGRAIALGMGGGLGAAGAGIGIGVIYSAMIQSLARQPEMRKELTQVQRLGFALTEACFFYGLVAGLSRSSSSLRAACRAHRALIGMPQTGGRASADRRG